MSKKIITLHLAASLVSTAFASCGEKTDDNADTTVADETTAEVVEEINIKELAAAVTGEFGDLYDPANEMGMPLAEYYANFAADEYSLTIPGFENPEEDLGTPASEYIASEMNNLYGIETAWVEEFLSVKAASMTNIDTLLVVKPSEGNMENVVNALNSYNDYLKNDSFQYPINLPKIRAAKVVEQGDYAFFVMLGSIPDELIYVEIDYENLTEDEIAAKQAEIDAAMDEYAAGNTQKAIDAITNFLG